MTDTQFWMVYFHHCKHLLPPEAFGLPAAALTPAPTPVPAAQPGTSSSPATSTASAVQAAGVGPSSTPAAAVATPKGAAGAEDSQPTAVTPSQLAAGSTGGSAVQGGAGAEGEGSECGGRSPSSSAAHTEGGAGSGGGAGSACEDDVGGGSGSGCSGDEVDLLGDLEDDPELAAYLQVCGVGWLCGCVCMRWGCERVGGVCGCVLRYRCVRVERLSGWQPLVTAAPAAHLLGRSIVLVLGALVAP